MPRVRQHAETRGNGGGNVAALRAVTFMPFLLPRVKDRFAVFYPGQIRLDHFVVTGLPKIYGRFHR